MEDNISSKGYIFLCSNATEDECIHKGLFGAKEGSQDILGNIKIGDTLYLYNYTSTRLHGKFIAVSNSQINIDVNAWNGQFPLQVRVKRVEEYKPIQKKIIQDVIRFNNIFPVSILNTEKINILDALFKKENTIPKEEISFRNKFPALHTADDGHRVRSLGELTIDNWLFHQQICHGYERKLPIREDVYCDFCLPVPDTKEYVYIEYWGLEDADYLKRKKTKMDLYIDNNLKIIEISKKDLEALDDVLPKLLRPFLPNRRFY